MEEGGIEGGRREGGGREEGGRREGGGREREREGGQINTQSTPIRKLLYVCEGVWSVALDTMF